MRRFSSKVDYDPEMDSATWKGWKPAPFGAIKGWKGELTQRKSAASLRKRAAKIRAPEERKRLVREAAELDVQGLVRQVAGALQMALQGLHDTPVPVGQYEHHVNYQKLHNVLVDLRTKCGVKFDDGDVEYSEKKPLDYGHVEHNPVREGMEYQRMARIAQTRETAEKVAAFINQGGRDGHAYREVCSTNSGRGHSTRKDKS